MTAGSRSSPAITSAGSPGSRCCSEKIRIDTKNSVGTNCTRHFARKLSMMRARGPPSSFQFQPDHTDNPVGHRLETFQPAGLRKQIFTVIEIDDRFVVEQDFGQ